MSNNPELLTAGIDEAGRGPLAGPVVAAAVILDSQRPVRDLADSKKLTERKREKLFDDIFDNAKAVATGIAHREEIDTINIYQATLRAMQRALNNLTIQPDVVLIDGLNMRLDHPRTQSIVRGDALEPAIGAASIVAKVTRDRMMAQFDKLFPEYGFVKHKGYGTKAHLKALREHGACPIHRQSFRPVREYLPHWRDFESPRHKGKLAERLAGAYLVGEGYTVCELNYVAPHQGEIDIIANHGGELVFVEVKAGSPGEWGAARNRIDEAKRDRIMAAAQRYQQEKDIDSAVRFDVISVTFTKRGPQIKHDRSGIYAY